MYEFVAALRRGRGAEGQLYRHDYDIHLQYFIFNKTT